MVERQTLSRWSIKTTKGSQSLTAVFDGSGKASGSCAIVRFRYLFAFHYQTAPEEVLPFLDVAVGCLCVHTGEIMFHLLGGKHVDVLEAERLEYVFLKVVVQRHSRYSFNHSASPVNPNLEQTYQHHLSTF